MAINLGGKVSDEDKNRVNSVKNPSANEVGDDFSSLMGDTSGLFDNLDDAAFGEFDGSGGAEGDPFGGGAGAGGDPFGGGMSDPFQSGANNQMNQNGGMIGNGFTGNSYNNTQNQQVQAKPDNIDKFMEYSSDAALSFGKVMIEFVKSFKNRTNDDIGYLSSSLIKTGAVMLGVGVVASIIGAITKVEFLSIFGMGQQLLLSGALTTGTGICTLAYSAVMISSSVAETSAGISSLSDVSSEMPDDSSADYEESFGDILDSLLADDDENLSNIDCFDATFNNTRKEEESLPNFGEAPVKIDLENKLKEITENKVISRRSLVDTFVPFLPLNTPEFATRREMHDGDADFMEIETICLKALANVMKCEIEEVRSSMTSCYETYFSYEIQLNRVKGLNKTSDLAAELEVYFRESATDTSVNATVDMEQDYYKAVITKGVKAVVTLGDVLRQDYVREFISNEKNKLPIVVGISELGKVMIEDAKSFDTMMICGKPRSGKSWYVLSILMSLMLFNSPEKVQMCIVDPKESNLFKTLSLMPHVCGLHTDAGIIELMDDIIINEGGRRKRILNDNKCDDIWDLRKKGIVLPILYLIIDEYITVKNNLGEAGTELDMRLQTIMSQLPSQGIRVIFVPHRATGIVNKTNRTMLQFTASVRSNIEDTKDSLDTKKWSRSLTNQGDIAIKTSSSENAMYIRGAAITASDEENTELIESIAKAFYKMGVDLPDMSTLEVGCNRNEDKIRSLLVSGSHMQYDVNNFLKDDY